MPIKTSDRLSSSTDTTQVLVIRAPSVEVELMCGGSPMLSGGEAGGRLETTESGPDAVLIGKRYVDENLGIEVICTKSGAGPLSVEGRSLEVKTPKSLPSSD